MDGTTATTLAPSEEDMQKIADVFARMRDTVIDASKLATEVNELRNSVGALRNEITKQAEEFRRENEALRSTNRWMDGQITELRVARDNAQGELNAAHTELSKVTEERNALQRHADNQRETLARLNEQVAGLRKERDDALFQVELVKDAKDDLKNKLDAVMEVVCPKSANPTSVNVVTEVSGRSTLAEQPRDPETQQFKPWDNHPDIGGTDSAF